jgi:hypothetical protein
MKNNFVMREEFVSFEVAVNLKNVGFDEPCIALYKNKKLRYEIKDCNGIVDFYNEGGKVISYLAPTFSQAFRFFREKYKMAIINPDWNNKFKYEIFNLHLLNQGVLVTKSGFETYEEAELACLQKMIEIVKNI